MAKKKGKSVSFDAMVKFFLQYYNIPSRNDIIKLMDKIDRLEMLIMSSEMTGKGGAISGVKASKSRASTRRTEMTSTDQALEIIKRFRKGIGFADTVERGNGLPRETALWEIRRALHVEQDVVRFQLIFDSGVYVH